MSTDPAFHGRLVSLTGNPIATSSRSALVDVKKAGAGVGVAVAFGFAVGVGVWVAGTGVGVAGAVVAVAVGSGVGVASSPQATAAIKSSSRGMKTRILGLSSL